MSGKGLERHCELKALKRYVLAESQLKDAKRIDAHLAVCKSVKVTPGRCHTALTHIEDELFAIDRHVRSIAVRLGEYFASASDVARLLRITHDRRVVRGICFSEAALRAAVDNATQERKKIRAHARSCPFCRIYLSGSGTSLIIAPPRLKPSVAHRRPEFSDPASGDGGKDIVERNEGWIENDSDIDGIG